MPRLGKLLLGIMIAAMGVYASIQANIGFSPWNAFAVGLSSATGLTIGTATGLLMFLCLLVAFCMKERIGLACIANVFGIGPFLDLYISLGLFPRCGAFLPGLLMLLLGLFLISFGSYLYLTSALGGGPRDALAVALGRRIPRLPVGILRAIVDSTAVLFGWLLHAKIGAGTIIAAIGLGLMMQLVFRVFHFDIAAVQNESLPDTARLLTARLKKPHAGKQ